MMRVLLDCRMADWSGVGRYSTGLTRALAARGDLDLVLMVADPAAAPVPAGRGVEHVIATKHPFTPAGGLEAGRIARGAKPDVTHSLHFPTPIPAPHPLVVTIHDLTPLVIPEVMKAFPHRLGYRIWNARVASQAQAIIADSAHTAADLARFFPRAARKTRVVPLAADDFAAGPVTELPADLHDWLHGAPYLLSGGNTKPHKDLPTLLRAFAELSAEMPDLRLLLTGEDRPGYVEGALAGAPGVDPAAVASRIRFTGRVDDATLRALYRDAAVFAFPSRYEGYGLPPLEAMSFGTPVVVSDAASLPEVVDGAATIVPVGDADTLASALRAAITDDRTRERLRAAGLERASQLTWARTAELTVAVYREVLSRTPVRQ